jgi:hypothetical protein
MQCAYLGSPIVENGDETRLLLIHGLSLGVTSFGWQTGSFQKASSLPGRSHGTAQAPMEERSKGQQVEGVLFANRPREAMSGSQS